MVLRDDAPNSYLCHDTEAGKFSLTSDSIVHSLIYVKRAAPIISQISKPKQARILSRFSTVPGYIIFPGNRIGGKMTINGARGCNARICDRYDLTLECIRRHYGSEASPLSEVLFRYRDFFALFQSFNGYIEFFLLNELWNHRLNRLNAFLPFDGSFPKQPLPKSLDDYETFIENQSTFLQARAERMTSWLRMTESP